MKLNIDLLRDQNEYELSENFKGCYNARGQYDSMQFVLRLRPDLHARLEKTVTGIAKSGDYDFETIQAFSTFLHETIHWWQHVGSISGLILSLSYPIQSHINSDHLKDYIKHTGPIKPITIYKQMHAAEHKPNDAEFITINYILNNFYDIEFFKYLTINPRSAESFINDPFFESVGHTYHIAYSSFINVISSTFDRNREFLPKADDWHSDYRRLRDNKVQGYFHGSPVKLPPVGLKEIYEGQSRFSQIQYLYFGSGEALSWDDFENIGMLSGVYYSAFSTFLDLIESDRPDSIGSPLVALFLLVLDLAMNPTEGFPFDIFCHEAFIESVDPGIRFVFLCKMIATKHPELKSYIVECSSAEYIEASKKLSAAIISPSPHDAAAKISEWAKTKQTLQNLMLEERNFTFSRENQPIRLIFSRFIRYQEDKLKNPAYFCWPGIHSAGDKCSDENLRLFVEHQALFTDKADGDIYPKIFPDKDDSSVQEAFNTFYSWVATYDLCRQWIVGEGEFNYDYFWLTSKYSMDDLKKWARLNFKAAFGVDTEDFTVLRDN